MGRYAPVVRTGPLLWAYITTGRGNWTRGTPTIGGRNIRLPAATSSTDNASQVFEEFYHYKQIMRDGWTKFQVRSFIQFLGYGFTDVYSTPRIYEYEENCVSCSYRIISPGLLCI